MLFKLVDEDIEQKEKNLVFLLILYHIIDSLNRK